MRPHRFRVACAIGAWLAVVACSTAPTRPAEDGDCVPSDGVACSTPVPGGSSGGSGDGGTSACVVDGGAAECDQCLAASCCPEISSCEGYTPCANLVSCEDSCNLSASCYSACESAYPTGVADLQAITTCEAARCTVCGQSGVGDPCSSGFGVCVAGISCNGLYCTKPCAHSTDCAGIGNGGDDVLGFPNACVLVSGGDLCAPECSSSADCVDYPDTYCESTTTIEGATVTICAPLPDASTD